MTFKSYDSLVILYPGRVDLVKKKLESRKEERKKVDRGQGTQMHNTQCYETTGTEVFVPHIMVSL